jgi:hypothetical protein
MVGSIGFFLAKWLVATPSYQKPSAHLILIGETPVKTIRMRRTVPGINPPDKVQLQMQRLSLPANIRQENPGYQGIHQ